MDSSSLDPTSADPSAITFRVARNDDLPALVRMLADDPLGARREVYSDPLAAGYTDAFAAIDADPGNELIVAICDGAPVGMLQITFIPSLTYQGRSRAQIEGVRVASGARSLGIGGAMLQWAIGRARHRGCVMVQLTTDKAREDALRFYQHLGFVPSHHGMKLHL